MQSPQSPIIGRLLVACLHFGIAEPNCDSPGVGDCAYSGTHTV
jgi:hypothetical protein